MLSRKSDFDMRDFVAQGLHLQHRAFNDGGRCNHQGNRCIKIADGGFLLICESAPGSTFAIDQDVKINVLKPAFNRAAFQSLFFKIMEVERNRVLL